MPAQSPTPDVTATVSDSSNILTLNEASQLLRIDRITLSRLIRANRIPAANVGTGKRPVYRLARDEVMAWLRSRNGASSAEFCVPTSVAGDGGLPCLASDEGRSISPRPRRARSTARFRRSQPQTQP